ncbi:MAG: alkaline phosphatase family protein [Myxococcota bacterium]
MRSAWLAPWLAALALLPACVTEGPTREPALERTLAPLGSVPRTVSEGSWPEPGPGAPDRVLIVSIAGLTPDRYLGDDPDMPVLARLAREGITGEALVPIRPDTPFPVHATLVTGQPPSVHGIVADRLIGERGVRAVHFWHASRLTSPTLWERARDDRMEVAALGWPSTVGAGIDWLLPELDATRDTDSWLVLQRQTATPLLYSAVREAAPAAASTPGSPWPDRAARDGIVADSACRIAAEPDPPELWLLRFAGPDPVLRARGPRHPQAAEAFATADARLARVLDCLAASGALAQSAVFVVGDRALVPVHTAIEPNVWLAGAGLVDLSAEGGAVAAWRALSRSNGGSAFVYALDEGAAVEAKRVLSEAAARTRAFRVVPATELQAFRADPQAWFGLEAARGFAFGDAAKGGVLHASAERGVAGHLRPDRVGPVGFAAWGQGLRRGIDAPELYMEDVAPTVAALLGLNLGLVDGRIMIGLIEPRQAPSPVSSAPGEDEP